MPAPTILSLTSAQIEHYRRDGYVVVPDLLAGDEIDRFVAYEAEAKPDGWRHNLRHHVEDEVWRSLARHPRIAGGAAQLLGGTPMIVQTMYLEKQPAGDDGVGGRGVALHQDVHYLPCEPETLMACWVAMSDTNPENGGLCVVPGSHRGGLYSTHKTADADEHDAWEIDYLMGDRTGREWTQRMYSFEIDGLRREDVVALTVPKGAGVFFAGRTIHGSFANHSRARVRRAWAVHFVNAGTWVFRADVQELTPAL